MAAMLGIMLFVHLSKAMSLKSRLSMSNHFMKITLIILLAGF